MNNNIKLTFETELVNCPICGTRNKKTKLFSAPDRKGNVPGLFSIYRCNKCLIVFQNPRPKEKCINQLYPDNLNYFKPQDPAPSPLSRKLEKKVLINYYNYTNLGIPNVFDKLLVFPLYILVYRSMAIPHFVKNGALLDVGCSHGYQLQWMKKIGWKTFGFEPNKSAVKYAQKTRGLNVKMGTLKSVDYQKDCFDVIILNMVMEHLYNPKLAVKQISKWLKKDGQLILSIPWFEGLEFRVFGKYCYSLHLPNHNYFYNKNALEKLFNKNFFPLKYIFQWNNQDFSMSLKYLHQEKRRLGLFLKIITHNFMAMPLKIFIFFHSLVKPTSRVTIFTTKRF